MKNQTIKLIIANKLRWWAASITDENVRSIVEQNAILTGGAIVSLLQNETPKDFDFYFRTLDAAEAVAKYYCDQQREANKESTSGEYERPTDKGRLMPVRMEDRIKLMIRGVGAQENKADGTESKIESRNFEEGAQHFESDPEADAIVQEASEAVAEDAKKEATPRYRVLFMSANAITLSDGVQIVLRFCGEPDEIHKNYDFVHCTSYYTAWDKKLTLRPEAVLAILQKELIYVGSKYPVCSLIRVRKFIKRGWSITAGQMLKMIFQCKELNLGDIAVLEEQLTGVDTTYFKVLLDAIGRDKESGKERQIDSIYICELIDRILK